MRRFPREGTCEGPQENGQSLCEYKSLAEERLRIYDEFGRSRSLVRMPGRPKQFYGASKERFVLLPAGVKTDQSPLIWLTFLCSMVSSANWPFVPENPHRLLMLIQWGFCMPNGG